ncbi:MAG: alpha/beta hydrolase, partial [Raoultibacter sp.]
NRESYDQAIPRLPEGYTEVVIEGGNHAQFGNYGVQAGDGEATISPQEQWDKTASAIADFIHAG